jgi:hypothetical protein
MGALGDYCPICLEDYMNGCADTGEEVSTNG